MFERATKICILCTLSLKLVERSSLQYDIIQHIHQGIMRLVPRTYEVINFNNVLKLAHMNSQVISIMQISLVHLHSHTRV